LKINFENTTSAILYGSPINNQKNFKNSRVTRGECVLNVGHDICKIDIVSTSGYVKKFSSQTRKSNLCSIHW
jgi:hypothetical protein